MRGIAAACYQVVADLLNDLAQIAALICVGNRRVSRPVKKSGLVSLIALVHPAAAVAIAAIGQNSAIGVPTQNDGDVDLARPVHALILDLVDPVGLAFRNNPPLISANAYPRPGRHADRCSICSTLSYPRRART